MAARVLVVDDSMSVRKAIEKMLGDKLDIITVDGPQAARDVIAQQRPVLIISDVIMPSEDGFVFTRSLKKQPRTRAIPVLLMSGVVDEDSQTQAKAAGAIGMLKKPFDKEELTKVVGRIFRQLRERKKRLEQEKEKRLKQEIAANAAQRGTSNAANKASQTSDASPFELSSKQVEYIRQKLHHITTSANALTGWVFSAGATQCQVGSASVDPQNLVLFLYLMREAGAMVAQELELQSLDTTMFEYKEHTLLVSSVFEDNGEAITIVLLLDTSGALSMARYLLRKAIPEIRQILRIHPPAKQSA